MKLPFLTSAGTICNLYCTISIVLVAKNGGGRAGPAVVRTRYVDDDSSYSYVGLSY